MPHLPAHLGLFSAFSEPSQTPSGDVLTRDGVVSAGEFASPKKRGRGRPRKKREAPLPICPDGSFPPCSIGPPVEKPKPKPKPVLKKDQILSEDPFGVPSGVFLLGIYSVILKGQI